MYDIIPQKLLGLSIHSTNKKGKNIGRGISLDINVINYINIQPFYLARAISTFQAQITTHILYICLFYSIHLTSFHLKISNLQSQTAHKSSFLYLPGLSIADTKQTKEVHMSRHHHKKTQMISIPYLPFRPISQLEIFCQ